MSESLILAQAVQALQRRIDRLERKEVGVGLPNGTIVVVTLANGDNHDVAIGAGSYIRIAGPTGAFAITGFAGGAPGRLLFVRSGPSQTLTLKHDNAGSTSANRLHLATAADLSTGLRARMIFVYDSAIERWTLFSVSGSAGAA
jgi:hypothetical protein